MRMRYFLCAFLLMAALHCACSPDNDNETKAALQDMQEESDPSSGIISVEVNAKGEHLSDYLKLLKNRDWRTRLKAIELLGDLDGCEEAQEALIRVLETGNVPEKSTAAHYLRMKKAIPALIRALRDKHPAVRISAASSLGVIGDASAIEPLTSLLNDKDKTVRLEAAESLFRLDDHSGLPIVRSLLEDDDEFVGHRALMTIDNMDYYIRLQEGKDQDIECSPDITLEEARRLIGKIEAWVNKARLAK